MAKTKGQRLSTSETIAIHKFMESIVEPLGEFPDGRKKIDFKDDWTITKIAGSFGVLPSSIEHLMHEAFGYLRPARVARAENARDDFDRIREQLNVLASNFLRLEMRLEKIEDDLGYNKKDVKL